MRGGRRWKTARATESELGNRFEYSRGLPELCVAEPAMRDTEWRAVVILTDGKDVALCTHGGNVRPSTTCGGSPTWQGRNVPAKEHLWSVAGDPNQCLVGLVISMGATHPGTLALKGMAFALQSTR